MQEVNSSSSTSSSAAPARNSVAAAVLDRPTPAATTAAGAGSLVAPGQAPPLAPPHGPGAASPAGPGAPARTATALAAPLPMIATAPTTVTARGFGLASRLAFWLIMLPSVGLFGLAVLSMPLAELRALQAQRAVEEAKVQQYETLAGDLTVVRDALSNNPQYLSRRIREELGYQRVGEQAVTVELPRTGPAIYRLQPEIAPPTRAESFCLAFSQPMVRSLSLLSSVLLMAMAFLFFDIPTKESHQPGPAGK